LKARVHITLKTGVLDPQGKAIAHALGSLGFAGVENVRQGKYIEIDLADTVAMAAWSRVESMCQRLLANAIVEDYKVELLG